MDLKIVGWTDFESEYPSITVSNEEIGEVIGVVVDEIKAKGYAFSGEEHQSSYTGVPVFDNGTCLRASMRSWGMIMTFAYPEVDGKITQYMDFYMSSAVTKKMPESSSIDIQPADSDNFNAMITQQDGEMISQSLQMGIPFMTTDKALNRLMDEIQESMGEIDEDCDCGCDDDCDCDDCDGEK